MSAKEKYKTLTFQEKMEVLNKLVHGASIQSVINQYGVSRYALHDIKINCKRTLEFVLKQDDPCSDLAK
jgi:hypothetical protein